MTENEATKVLEYTKRNCGMPEQGEKWKANRETIAIDMAIKALEEIQQYREIGTVEECREARERQRTKKAISLYLCGRSVSGCPACRKRIGIQQKYCEECGQRIDWS